MTGTELAGEIVKMGVEGLSHFVGRRVRFQADEGHFTISAHIINISHQDGTIHLHVNQPKLHEEDEKNILLCLLYDRVLKKWCAISRKRQTSDNTSHQGQLQIL